MNTNQYEQLAMKTEASQSSILSRFQKMSHVEKLLLVELMNGIHGLTDEVGELNSALKKHFEYGQPLDKGNIKEEVGDCLWRLSQICNSLDFTLEECMVANIEKLHKGRYKDGYSDEAAKEENRNREIEIKLVKGIDIPLPREVPMVNTLAPIPTDGPDSAIIQNGNGWGEPPEEDESGEWVDYSVSELKEHTEKGFHIGLDIGVEIAKEVADLMDGQERNEALRMVEVRKEGIRFENNKTKQV